MEMEQKGQKTAGPGSPACRLPADRVALGRPRDPWEPDSDRDSQEATSEAPGVRLGFRGCPW